MLDKAQSYNKSVLLAPLDWGLGHASRCIPIVRYLQEKGCRVTFAGEGMTCELIREEFPSLKTIPLKGYRVRYAQRGFFFMPLMLLQLPKILFAIRREQKWLKSRSHEFDLIISDNRYGLFAKGKRSVLITHQLQVITGWGAMIDLWIGKRIHRLIERFDTCWIPDQETKPGIAGRLSHPTILPTHAQFIGPISRMASDQIEHSGKIAVVLSGPEPQRTLLEKKLITALEGYNNEVVFVRGVSRSSALPQAKSHIHFENHLNAKALGHVMGEAEIIICRSGYSSIMDLLKMRKKAVLIPTPGQTEQLYLTKQVLKQEWFAAEEQETLDLRRGLEKAKQLDLSKRPSFNFEGYRQALAVLGIQ